MPTLIDLEAVDPHTQSVLDIMPGPLRHRSWWTSNRDLGTLLRKFRSSQAGDPRDLVYTLLGISSDAHSEQPSRRTMGPTYIQWSNALYPISYSRIRDLLHLRLLSVTWTTSSMPLMICLIEFSDGTGNESYRQYKTYQAMLSSPTSTATLNSVPQGSSSKILRPTPSTEDRVSVQGIHNGFNRQASPDTLLAIALKEGKNHIDTYLLDRSD